MKANNAQLLWQFGPARRPLQTLPALVLLSHKDFVGFFAIPRMGGTWGEREGDGAAEMYVGAE
jgi:hypothetical protein